MSLRLPAGRFLVVLLLINCLYAPRIRAEEFSLRSPDKQTHVAATYAISLALSSGYRKAGMSKTNAFWLGMATTFAIGLAKETFHDKTFNKGDVLANGIGSVGGSLTFLVVGF